MRSTLFGAILLAGAALAVLGFFGAAPIGPTSGPEYSNPRLAFAPAVFVAGVVLMFLSAVVYELYRGRG